MSDDWKTCGTRNPWVASSLKVRAREMRKKAANCRKAFNKPWMGVPANHLADVYDEAAAIFEARLAELTAIPPLTE